jgi:hypothetical protein
MKTTRITLDLTDRQVTKLRELMDALPLSGYADLILPILKALPLESAVGSTPNPDARPAQSPSEPGRGSFFLHALTSKGEAQLPEIQRLLNRLPHGEDLL